MPPEIWETAVELARQYGPCQIARGVGVDYKTLRLRLAKAVGSPKLVRPTSVQLPSVLPERHDRNQEPFFFGARFQNPHWGATPILSLYSLQLLINLPALGRYRGVEPNWDDA